MNPEHMNPKFKPGDHAMHDLHGEIEVIQSADRCSGRGYLVRPAHPTQYTGAWYHDGTPMLGRGKPFWAPWYLLAVIPRS